MMDALAALAICGNAVVRLADRSRAVEVGLDAL
jgi:hypothetical protein